MTLEEFRRTWIQDYTPPETASAKPSTSRLMFVPAKEVELAPRIVFRETFAAPPADKKPRKRMRVLGMRVMWATAACLATAATGVAMSKAFDYAPTYIDKYIMAR